MRPRLLLAAALLLCICLLLQAGEKALEHAVVFVCFGPVPKYQVRVAPISKAH